MGPQHVGGRAIYIRIQIEYQRRFPFNNRQVGQRIDAETRHANHGFAQRLSKGLFHAGIFNRNVVGSKIMTALFQGHGNRRCCCASHHSELESNRYTALCCSSARRSSRRFDVAHINATIHSFDAIFQRNAPQHLTAVKGNLRSASINFCRYQ